MPSGIFMNWMGDGDMASRKFFGKVLEHEVNEILMTGKEGHDATVVVTITNQGPGPVRLSLALADSDDLSGSWLYYNVLLNSHTSKELRGIVVPPNVSLVARYERQGGDAIVNAVGYGFESEV